MSTTSLTAPPSTTSLRGSTEGELTTGDIRPTPTTDAATDSNNATPNPTTDNQTPRQMTSTPTTQPQQINQLKPSPPMTAGPTLDELRRKKLIEEIYLLLNSAQNPLLKGPMSMTNNKEQTTQAIPCSRSNCNRIIEEFVGEPAQTIFYLWLLSNPGVSEQTEDLVKLQYEIRSVDDLIQILNQKFQHVQYTTGVERTRILKQLYGDAVYNTLNGKKNLNLDETACKGLMAKAISLGSQSTVDTQIDQLLQAVSGIINSAPVAFTSTLTSFSTPSSSEPIVTFPPTYASLHLLSHILATFLRQLRTFNSFDALLTSVQQEVHHRQTVEKQILEFVNQPTTRLFGPRRKPWLHGPDHNQPTTTSFTTDPTIVPYLYITSADVSYLYDNSHDAGEDIMRYLQQFHAHNVAAKHEDAMKGTINEALLKQTDDLTALKNATGLDSKLSPDGVPTQELTPVYFPSISALAAAVTQSHASFHSALLETFALFQPEARLFVRPSISTSLEISQAKDVLLTEIQPPQFTYQLPMPAAPGIAPTTPSEAAPPAAQSIGFENVLALLKSRHQLAISSTPPTPFTSFTELHDWVKSSWYSKLAAIETEKVRVATPIIQLLTDKKTTLLTNSSYQSSLKDLTNVQLIYQLLYIGSDARDDTVRHLQMLGYYKYKFKFQSLEELAVNLKEYTRLYELEKRSVFHLLNERKARLWRTAHQQEGQSTSTPTVASTDSSSSSLSSPPRVTLEEVATLMSTLSSLPLNAPSTIPLAAYSSASCSSLLRLLWSCLMSGDRYLTWAELQDELLSRVKKQVDDYVRLITYLTDGQQCFIWAHAFKKDSKEQKVAETTPKSTADDEYEFDEEPTAARTLPPVLSFQLSSSELNQLIEFSGNSISNLLFYLQYLHKFGFTVSSVRSTLTTVTQDEVTNIGVLELLQTVKHLHQESTTKKDELMHVLNHTNHKLFQSFINGQTNPSTASTIQSPTKVSSAPVSTPPALSNIHLSYPEIDLLFYDSHTGFDCLKYLSELNLSRGGAAFLPKDEFWKVLRDNTATSGFQDEQLVDPAVERGGKNLEKSFRTLTELIVELQRREQIQTATRNQLFAILTSQAGRALFDSTPDSPVLIDRTSVDALIRSTNVGDNGVKVLAFLRQFIQDQRQFKSLYELAISMKVKYIEEIQTYERGLASIQDALNKNSNMTLLRNLKLTSPVKGKPSATVIICNSSDAERLFQAGGSSAATTVYLLWELNANQDQPITTMDELITAVSNARVRLDENKLQIYKFLKSAPAAQLFISQRAPLVKDAEEEKQATAAIEGMDTDPLYSYQSSITLDQVSKLFEATQAGPLNALHLGEILKRLRTRSGRCFRNLQELGQEIQKVHAEYKSLQRQEMAPIVQFLSSSATCSLWTDSETLPSDLDTKNLTLLLSAGQTRLDPLKDGWCYKSSTLVHLRWMEDMNGQMRQLKQTDSTLSEPFKFSSVIQLIPFITALHSRMMGTLYHQMMEVDPQTSTSLLFQSQFKLREMKVAEMDRFFLEAGSTGGSSPQSTRSNCYHQLPTLLQLLMHDYNPSSHPSFPFHALYASLDELILAIRSKFEQIEEQQISTRMKLKNWFDLNGDQLITPKPTTASENLRQSKKMEEEKEESKEQMWEESKEQPVSSNRRNSKKSASLTPIRFSISDQELNLLLSSCKSLDLNTYMDLIAERRGEPLDVYQYMKDGLEEQIPLLSKTDLFTGSDGRTYPMIAFQNSVALITNPELFAHLNHYLSLHSPFPTVKELAQTIKSRDKMLRFQMGLVFNYLNHSPACTILTNPFTRKKLKIYPGDVITIFDQIGSGAGIYILHLLWHFDAIPSDSATGSGNSGLYFDSLGDLILALKYGWLEFETRKRKDWDLIRSYVNNPKDCFLFSWSDEDEKQMQSGQGKIDPLALTVPSAGGRYKSAAFIPKQRLVVREVEIGWILSAASGESLQDQTKLSADSALFQFQRPSFSAISGRETLFHLQNLSENGLKFSRIQPDLLLMLSKAHQSLIKIKKHMYLHLRNKTKLFQVPTSSKTGGNQEKVFPLTMQQLDRLFESHGFALVPIMIAQFEAALGTPQQKYFSSLDDLSLAIDAAKMAIHAYLVGTDCHILSHELQHNLRTHDTGRLLVECTDLPTCFDLLATIQDESIGYKFPSISLLVLELRKKQRERNEMKKKLLSLLQTPPAPGMTSIFNKADQPNEIHAAVTAKLIDALVLDSAAGERTLEYIQAIQEEIDQNGPNSIYAHTNLTDLMNSVHQKHVVFLEKLNKDRDAIRQYLTSSLIRNDFILYAGSEIGVGGSSLVVSSTHGQESESLAVAASAVGVAVNDGTVAPVVQTIGTGSTLPLPRELRCSALDARKLLEAIPGHSCAAVLAHLHYLNMDTAESFRYVIPDLAMTIVKMEADAVNARSEIYDFLRSSKCTFWRVANSKSQLTPTRPMPTSLTHEDVTQIYNEGEAGPETLFYLWNANREKQSFYTVDQVIAYLKKSKLASRENSISKTADKPKLLAHLTNPACELLERHVNVTAQDLEDLLACTYQSLPDLINILDSLNLNGSHYSTVGELAAGIKSAHDAQSAAVKELLRYLTDPERRLWGADQDVSTKIRWTITESRIENLMQESMTGTNGTVNEAGQSESSDTMYYCRYLEARGFIYESFSELINAIKILHLTRMEQLKKLEQALTAPNCQFFQNSQPMVHVNRKLCMYIDDCVQGGTDPTKGVSQQTPIDLLSLTEDLIAKNPQPRFGTVNEFIDALKLLSLNLSKEDQTAILAFLLHPNCTLFEAGLMESLVITTTDVKKLVEAGGAGKHTLNVLKYLDSLDSTNHLVPLVGLSASVANSTDPNSPFRKFHSLPDLALGIQTAFHLSEEKKHELYAHLSSKKLCTLFSQCQIRPTITMELIDRLFHESGARNQTLAIIQRLDHQLGKKFSSIPELIPAVRSMYAANQAQFQVDKKILYQYLSVPSCHLLHPEIVVDELLLEGDEEGEEGIQASSSLANHDLILAQLSSKNLGLILREGRGLVSTLNYFKFWEDDQHPAQRRSFANVKELISELHTAVIADVEAVYKFLTGPENILLNESVVDMVQFRTTLSKEDCIQLLESGQSGPYTILIMRDMVQEGLKRYDNITELGSFIATWYKTHNSGSHIESVEDTRTQMLNAMIEAPANAHPSVAALMNSNSGTTSSGPAADLSESDMVSLLNYLERPDVTLLGAPGSEGVQLSRRGLLRLLDAGRTRSEGTLKLLQQLQTQGRTFSSLAQLAPVVQEQHLESIKLSLELLTFFSSAECILFESLHGGFDLNMSDMAVLLEDGGARSETINIVKQFNNEGRSFTSLTDLAVAIKEAERKAKRKHDSWLVLSYLTGPTCHLLPVAITSQLKNAPIQKLLNAAGGSGTTCVTILKKLEASHLTYTSIEALVKDVKEGILHKIPIYLSLKRLPIPPDSTGNTRCYVRVFVEDAATHVFKLLGTSNKHSILSSVDVEYVDFASPFFVEQRSHAKDVSLKFALYLERGADSTALLSPSRAHIHLIGAPDASVDSSASSSAPKKLNFDLVATSSRVDVVTSPTIESNRIESKLNKDQLALDDASRQRGAGASLDSEATDLSFITATDGLIGTAIVSLNAYNSHDSMPLKLMQGTIALEVPSLILSHTPILRKANITAADQQEFIAYLSSPQCKLFSDAGWLNVSKEEINQIIMDGNGIHSTIELLKNFDMNYERFQNFEELQKAMAMGLANPVPIYISCRSLPAIPPSDSVVVEVYLRDLKSAIFQFVGSTEYIDGTLPSASSPDFENSIIVDVYSRKDQEMKLQVYQIDRVKESATVLAGEAAGITAPFKTLLGEVLLTNGAFARSPESLELSLVKGGQPISPTTKIILKHVQIQRVNLREEEVKSVLAYLSNPKLCRLFSTAGWLSLELGNIHWLMQEGGGGIRTLQILQQLDSAGKKFLTMDQLVTAVARIRQKEGQFTPASQQAGLLLQQQIQQLARQQSRNSPMSPTLGGRQVSHSPFSPSRVPSRGQSRAHTPMSPLMMMSPSRSQNELQPPPRSGSPPRLASHLSGQHLMTPQPSVPSYATPITNVIQPTPKSAIGSSMQPQPPTTQRPTSLGRK